MTPAALPEPGAPVVELFEVPHTYPWRFRIRWRGTTHTYAGTPNWCATKRSAAARAAWRVRWMLDGTYARRYTSWSDRSW